MYDKTQIALKECLVYLGEMYVLHYLQDRKFNKLPNSCVYL